MAKSSGKHAVQRTRHGRSKLAVTGRNATRAGAVSRGARQHPRTDIAPIGEPSVVTSDDEWAETPDADFDPYDELDDLLDEDE